MLALYLPFAIMFGQKATKQQIMLDGEQQLHHIGLVENYVTIHLSVKVFDLKT